MLRFGSHLSVAGGLDRAVASAVELSLGSLQVFTANQRQWSPKTPDARAIRAFRSAVRRAKIGPVVSHASYLINLATGDRQNRTQSIRALGAELDRCAALGIKLCVVHPGAHLGDGVEAGIRRIAEALDEIYAARPACKVKTLLETTAGQGTSIGHRFEHLAEIIDRADCARHLAVCVDTCHIHAAGYVITTRAGYDKTMTELIACVGRSRIRCLHLNDSKPPRGSRVDRHEHIGRGTIKAAGFRNVVNDTRLAGLPGILETPKGDDPRGRSWDGINLRRLRGYVAR
ncbi:MAG: deoxyribonuclease IV [Planctomycetes bacterium]|nr:deoxyribonuclease IV [Planctomycetota bacterium]